MTHSCPWSNASACDHPHPHHGELTPKTRERVTAHASLQLEQLRRVGASDLATVRLADLRIVEPARGAAEVLERVVDRET